MQASCNDSIKMIKGAKELRPSVPLWLASSHGAPPCWVAEEAQSCTLFGQKRVSQLSLAHIMSSSKTGWKVCPVSCWQSWLTCHLLAGYTKGVRLMGYFSALLLTEETREAWCFPGCSVSMSKWAVHCLNFSLVIKVWMESTFYNCTAINLMAEQLANHLEAFSDIGLKKQKPLKIWCYKVIILNIYWCSK